MRVGDMELYFTVKCILRIVPGKCRPNEAADGAVQPLQKFTETREVTKEEPASYCLLGMSGDAVMLGKAAKKMLGWPLEALRRPHTEADF